MTRINGGRVIAGGLLAGLVMNLVDAAVNGIVLAERWNAETMALNPRLMQQAGTTSVAGWVLVDFLTGIVIVWLYAAMRPRFGEGPSTALRAGLAVWVVAQAIYLSYAFNGLFSWGLIGASTAARLVAAVAGAYAGGWLYREPVARV